MVDYRRSEIVTGLFITAAIAVFALFAFKVGAFDLSSLLGGRTLRLRAYFTDTKTLDVGAKVTVAGRRVGRVEAMALVAQPVAEGPDGDGVRDGRPAAQVPAGQVPDQAGRARQRQVVEVTFTLDDAALRLAPAAARVMLAQDGFLGSHFLALDPGTWTAGAEPPTIFAATIPPGSRGSRLEVKKTVGLDDMVALLEPVVHELRALMRTLGEGVLAPQNVDALGRSLQSLERGIDAATGTVQALRERLTQGTFDKLDGLLDQGRSTIVSADRVLQTTQSLLDGEGGSARKLLADLAAATDNLRQRLDSMQGDLRTLLGTTNSMLADNRADIDEILRRLRRTTWQAEMAVRKVRANPSFLLFGDQEPDLEAIELDETGRRRSGRARPYGQRDESDAGKE